MIRDIKILPYFVHLLENESSKQLYTFILELIYTTIKIKYPEVVQLNYQMIIQSSGLENLINLLSRTYIEQRQKAEVPKRISRGEKIIRILDIMLKTMDKKSVYPVSLVRAFCEKKEHLASIVQVLLVDDPSLRKKAIKFIGNYLVSPRINLKDTGIVDFLIACIDERTGKEALSLLYRIQNATENYNSDIDFSKFSRADNELININDRIKNSVFLRYFPVPFVKFLIEEVKREIDSEPVRVLAIFTQESTIEPSLIWCSSMRKLLSETITKHLLPFKKELDDFTKSKKPNFRKVQNMPIYASTFKEIVKYPEVEKEIRCGEYYLRIWNMEKRAMEDVSQEVFLNNLEGTFNEITSKFPEVNLDSFCIVIKSFAAAYVNYNKKKTFPCYQMFLKVMEKVCETIKEPVSKLYIKMMFKFIKKIIGLGTNSTAFEEVKGSARIISVLITWLDSLRENKFETLKRNDLVGIRWGIAIIIETTEKTPTLWNSIDFTLRKNFLKNVFELTYYLQRVIYEGDLLPISGKPKIKHMKSLTQYLKVTKVEKEPTVEYNEKSILEIIKSTPELYIINSMIHTLEIVYYLLNNLSQSTDCQKELLLTGCGVIGLAHLLESDKKNYEYLRSNFQMDSFGAFALITFRHLAGFVTQIRADCAEPLKSFGDCVQAMMTDHLIKMITANIEVVAHRIKETKTTVENLQQALEKLVKDIEHPQCIWNESTRKELKEAIKDQIEFFHTSTEINEANCTAILSKLKYSAYKEEIILGGVFIRLLNKDPYMRLARPNQIMKEIIQELGTVNLSELETTPALFSRVVALFESLNNIIVYQKDLELSIITQSNIKSLCGYLTLESDKVPKNKEIIFNSVFSILLELSKDIKQTLNLITTAEFIRLTLQVFLKLNNEFVAKRFIACIENIVAQHETDDALINTGLLVVFFKHAFNKIAEKRYRVPFMSFAQTVVSRNKFEGKLVALFNIIPRPLFERLLEESTKNAEDWIRYIDDERKEIPLIWNKELHNKVKEGLEMEMTKIETSLKEKDGPIVWKEPTTSYIAEFVNKGQINIYDVNLGIFIKNTWIKLKRPYSKFLDALAENILLNITLLVAHKFNKPEAQVEAKAEEDKKVEEVKKAEEVKGDISEILEAHQQGLVCMLSTLLLCYEQLYKNNNYGYIKLGAELAKKSSGSKDAGCSAISNEILREILVVGLKVTNSAEMVVAVMQIAYILCEQKDFLEKDDLRSIANAVIIWLTNVIGANESIEKVSEVLAICVLLKILDKIPMTKNADPLLDIFMNSSLLNKMQLMNKFKPHLKNLTEVLIVKICQYPVYYKKLVKEFKYDLNPEVKLDKMIKGKYEPIDKVWRKSPTRKEDCTMYESFTTLEEFDAMQINSYMLPLISKKVHSQEKFADAFKYMYEKYQAEWTERKERIYEKKSESVVKK